MDTFWLNRNNTKSFYLVQNDYKSDSLKMRYTDELNWTKTDSVLT